MIGVCKQNSVIRISGTQSHKFLLIYDKKIPISIFYWLRYCAIEKNKARVYKAKPLWKNKQYRRNRFSYDQWPKQPIYQKSDQNTINCFRKKHQDNNSFVSIAIETFIKYLHLNL